jgi:hypothetical protein
MTVTSCRCAPSAIRMPIPCAEDRRVRADADRTRQHCHGCEDGKLQEPAKDLAQAHTK